MEKTLEGRSGAIHRFMLAWQLARISYLAEAIKRCNGEMDKRMGSYGESAGRLDYIPGVNSGEAEVLVSES